MIKLENDWERVIDEQSHLIRQYKIDLHIAECVLHEAYRMVDKIKKEDK